MRQGTGAPASLEMDCLKVLWHRAEATVAQVRAGLPRPLAYTTVMTVLDRMSVKGLVKRHKRGRAWSYSAGLDLETARAEAVRRLVASLFEADNRTLLNYLLSEGSRTRRRVEESSGIDDELL